MSDLTASVKGRFTSSVSPFPPFDMPVRLLENNILGLGPFRKKTGNKKNVRCTFTDEDAHEVEAGQSKGGKARAEAAAREAAEEEGLRQEHEGEALGWFIQ